MTKAGIMNLLAVKRAELEDAWKPIPPERLTLPGAAGLWSVKDIMAHIAYHERWMTDRLDEVRRGVVYTLTEVDIMYPNMRNFIEYQEFRDKPLEQVQAESHSAYQDLLAALRLYKDDEALFARRWFRGAHEPVTLHDLLRSKVIDHYGEHIPSLRRMVVRR